MSPDRQGPPDGAAEASVAGRITSGRQPQSEGVVMVVAGSSGHPDIAALSNEDGLYRLDGLAAGWYTLEAQLGTRSLQGRVTLTPGEEARLDFAFD